MPEGEGSPTPDQPGALRVEPVHALRDVLGYLGASAAGLALAGAAAGVLSHTAHLRMLGVPRFSLPASSYSEQALLFFVDSVTLLWNQALSSPVVALAVGVGTVTVTAILLASSRLQRLSAAADMAVGERAHWLYFGLAVAVVALSGWTLDRALQALRVTDLIWASSASQQPLGLRFHGWLRASDISGCLYYRSNADLGSECCRALGGHYARLLTCIGLAALALLLTRAVRQSPELLRLTRHRTGVGVTGRSVVALTDTLLHPAAVLLLVGAVLLVPANYGVLVRPTTYPEVTVVQGTGGRPACGFLLSSPGEDKTPVYILEAPPASPGVWRLQVLPTTSLGAMYMNQGKDILQTALARSRGL